MDVMQDRPATEPVVSTWRAIAASYAAASAALEHELGRRHELGVSEFEVLDRLAEAAPTHREVLARVLAGALPAVASA